MGRRRWFQFSLRSFLVVLTIGCLWLGWQVDGVREQRRAIKAVEALGGIARYDWQPKLLVYRKPGRKPVFLLSNQIELTPAGPAWLRSILGDDFFQDVELVMFSTQFGFDESQLRNCIQCCRRFRKLKSVVIECPVSNEMMFEFQAALPGCKLYQDGWGVEGTLW